MNPIKLVAGTGVPLLIDDVDTDRIIPARYLKCVTFDGLGEHVFEDDRQQDPKHPFDNPRFAQGRILIVGRNFGCGSSREHAPQALMRWGIRAIVGESFAEIFFGNCIGLGIPCVRVPRAELEKLASLVVTDPEKPITVDLQNCELRYPKSINAPLGSWLITADMLKEGVSPEDEVVPLEISESARNALMTGQWDFLSQLQQAEDQIRETAERLPYTSMGTD